MSSVKTPDAELNGNPVLKSAELVKSYHSRRVVDGVSIEVHPGEVVGLLGPNGAGKTTTFHMIIGFIRPEEGKVLLGELDITPFSMAQRALSGIGYLAQEPSVFRKLTVAQNILAVLEVRVKDRGTRKKRMEQILEELAITRLAKSKGYSLSGGERRRVEIGRALAADPRFLLLDEPFAGIDPITVEEIQKIISQLRSKGLGLLITDHNVGATLSITNRAYIICDGKILTSGTSERLASDPEARKIYLGEKFRLN
ncbi:MAG: LPS export ABC transporter ATP-binding protein [candidate division Zixibacteria bacterium]|nr:LPS export ABC transporter ATP-binding protein [candidate division Zixibacteria bacterium]